MKKFFKILLISIIVGASGGIICSIFVHKTELSHIEKMILQNNTVKESVENSKYPTINEPASSQVTVFAGDSVRTIRK
jgi:hypothetical protein